MSAIFLLGLEIRISDGYLEYRKIDTDRIILNFGLDSVFVEFKYFRVYPNEPKFFRFQFELTYYNPNI